MVLELAIRATATKSLHITKLARGGVVSPASKNEAGYWPMIHDSRLILFVRTSEGSVIMEIVLHIDISRGICSL